MSQNAGIFSRRRVWIVEARNGLVVFSRMRASSMSWPGVKQAMVMQWYVVRTRRTPQLLLSATDRLNACGPSVYGSPHLVFLVLVPVEFNLGTYVTRFPIVSIPVGVVRAI